jgi:hypothetical protein
MPVLTDAMSLLEALAAAGVLAPQERVAEPAGTTIGPNGPVTPGGASGKARPAKLTETERKARAAGWARERRARARVAKAAANGEGKPGAQAKPEVPIEVLPDQIERPFRSQTRRGEPPEDVARREQALALPPI